ncbi:MAG: helix-turn-helix transcriptional regulator [Chitinophagaceae bacterium]|nr:helix-turn-helix transcriptional regulator [Chitinophagaceae bacterium]
MEGAFLLEISKRIKEHRIEKRLTVQELADKSGVSKGLISQIENGRSIPSLPVLFGIIQSLEVALGDFFSNIASSLEEPAVIVRKKGEYESFQKENASGFLYHRIMVKNLFPATMDVVLFELQQESHRDLVTTDAFEYKYMIKGRVEYEINGSFYTLEEGDSLFFDGRLPHVPRNTGKGTAVMLIVYFFDQK